MNMLKQILSSFIVGGLFSVLGQGLMSLFALTLGGNSPFIVPFTLISLGLMGGMLFIGGIYQKIEKIGAFGAILPFSGLAAAVAGTFSGTKAQNGSSSAAVKAAISLVVLVLGTGTILSVIVGIVSFFTL